jgi:hypothetical protein
MKNLRKTRAVTYRRPGIPAVIIEGKWLLKKYRLNIGDIVDIDYQPNGVALQKNPSLSLENQKKRKAKVAFMQKLHASNIHDEASTQENVVQRSVEVGA